MFLFPLVHAMPDSAGSVALVNGCQIGRGMFVRPWMETMVPPSKRVFLETIGFWSTAQLLYFWDRVIEVVLFEAGH